MIPSQRELAELALRRQDELSRQLAGAQWSTSASLLPSVLRRSIVTITVCHETFKSLEEAAEDGSATLRRPPAVHVGEGSSAWSGRYGSVALSIPVDGDCTPERNAGARLWRAHLSLAMDSALIAYRDLLAASDFPAQRQALDSFLDYVSKLDEVEVGSRVSPGLKPVADGARKIRIVLDARRQNVEVSNALYRDLESLSVEGMAWCYGAALLAESFKRGFNGASDVRAAVNRVDNLRAALEKPQPPASPAGPPGPPFEERPRRISERQKS